MARDLQQLAQADVPGLRNTIREGGPANARDSIIVGGERRVIQDARVVTFLDDPSWDFSKLMHPDPNSQYVVPRPGETGPVHDLAGAQNLVDMMVIHTDITTSSRECFRILKMRGFSTHFMIDWDGTIYQGVDPVMMALHAASELRGNVNKFSIGLDMNCPQSNFAQSVDAVDPAKVGIADQFAQGGQRRMSDVVEINGVPWRSWGFTDAQYDALIKLLRELNVHFPKLLLAAPVDERGEIIWQVPKELDTSKIGLYGHMHLTPQKFDPGPGFDWARLLQGLTKEHNAFPIELQKGVSIASLLTKDKVAQLAELYYANAEQSEAGGYYPLGLGGQWHGGTHVHTAEGAPVLAMMDGIVVAARNGQSPELGSNNFVLVRHEVPFDPKDDKKKFVFFSLYMHLRMFDPDKDRTSDQYKDRDFDDPKNWDVAPEWVSNTRRGKVGGAVEEEPAARVADKAPKTDPGAPKAKAQPKGKKGKQGKDDKAAAKAKDAVGEGGAEGEEETNDFADPSSVNYRPYLEVGQHLDALKRGDVALFAVDGSDQTRVGAGKMIGRVGVFGDEGASEGVLHIEVFADGRWRQIVDLLGVHSEHWYEVESDTDDNLVCDSEDLLRTVLPDEVARATQRGKDLLTSRRSVAGDEVQAFFQTARLPGADGALARRVRKAITRHVSEWSDQVDWIKSMAAAQGWSERVEQFKTALQDERGNWRDTLFARHVTRALPYVWLTDDVAKHIGLETGGAWDGVLYHFHPIHFVMWLTFHTNTRLRVLAQGMDKKQLAKLRDKEVKAAEDRRLRGEWPEEQDHGDAFDTTALDEVQDPKEVLQDLWEAPMRQGEWRRQDDDKPAE
ncbi:MAG: hypothetical protein EXR79_00580 [Myxococcales bacterium]|nr:hypothetical protein [Myxococcales bacterium]